jgi:hypothetical protein
MISVQVPGLMHQEGAATGGTPGQNPGGEPPNNQNSWYLDVDPPIWHYKNPFLSN